MDSKQEVSGTCKNESKHWGIQKWYLQETVRCELKQGGTGNTEKHKDVTKFASYAAAFPKDTVESLESGRKMKNWVSCRAVHCIVEVMYCPREEKEKMWNLDFGISGWKQVDLVSTPLNIEALWQRTRCTHPGVKFPKSCDLSSHTWSAGD